MTSFSGLIGEQRVLGRGSDMDSFLELELIKKTLFKSAMKGNWYEVQRIYKQHPEIHRAKITRSGDTVLHVAVSDGKEHVVEQLLEVIQVPGRGRAVEALEIGNEGGNTPLHLAASIGNVRICERIGKIDPKLIGRRNCEGETPFFLAALHGRKDAFLCLHSIVSESGDSQTGYSYCRRSDGETILHCAIKGEYFDLAFQIIHLYKDLVNFVNESGFSALHLLASKPSAFPSGSRLGQFEKIIYHCIPVDKLEVRTQQPHPLPEELDRGDATKYPENHQTCVNLARLLWISIGLLAGWRKKRTSQPPIAEDSEGQRKPQHFPPNYSTCFKLIKLVALPMSYVLGLGCQVSKLAKIKQEKQKHVWSVQIMDELLERTSMYEYEDIGRKPQRPALLLEEEGIEPYGFMDGGDFAFNKLAGPSFSPEDDSGEDNIEETSKRINEDGEKDLKPKVENRQAPLRIAKNGATKEKALLTEIHKRESPLLIAAKHGVVEMVKKILELFPMAIHDMNTEKKNVVLLAVENRQPHIYKLLLDMKIATDSIFRQVDKDGNSALHLAARLGEYRPWLIPGAAIQMQWEIKWYEFVENSMPPDFFVRFNKDGKTPNDVFTETHIDLVQSGSNWLVISSESCSVVAALVATVAFETSSTVPGGVKDQVGTPNLENEPVFDMFAISSPIALCFSLTALLMFLSIITSRYQEKDFGTDVPRKLFLGLTSLFVSIASMLISFYAGHYFVLKDNLKFAAIPLYAITCLPVTFVAIMQCPLYFDLFCASFREEPQRSYK